tara:strand:+ start:1092 stop:1235 length:144 start_codon:yes stop_codon:yes gene_type:complete
MKTQNLIFAVALLFATGLSTSCSQDDLAEDQIYEQGIDKDEVKEEDT